MSKYPCYAEDGTRFTNSTECNIYDAKWRVNNKRTHIHLWDKQGVLIEGKIDEHTFDKVYYIMCDSIQAIQALIDWSKINPYVTATPYQQKTSQRNSLKKMVHQYYYINQALLNIRDNTDLVQIDCWQPATEVFTQANMLKKIMGN